MARGLVNGNEIFEYLQKEYVHQRARQNWKRSLPKARNVIEVRKILIETTPLGEIPCDDIARRYQACSKFGKSFYLLNRIIADIKYLKSIN